MPTVTSRPVLPSVRTGLTSADAQRRLDEFGPNEIRREQKTTRLALLAHQFASPAERGIHRDEIERTNAHHAHGLERWREVFGSGD